MLDPASALPYASTKREAELVALAAAAGGADVVVANPGFLIGPGDVHRVSTWPIDAYLSGKLRVSTNGGLAFTDARDVAVGLVALAERGRAGERTILANPAGNLSWDDFFALVGRVAGRRRLMVRLPAKLAAMGARVVPSPVSPGRNPRGRPLVVLRFGEGGTRARFPLPADRRDDRRHDRRPSLDPTVDSPAWVAPTMRRRLFAPLGPTYDRYAALLSYGQDPRWRRFLVSRIEAGPRRPRARRRDRDRGRRARAPPAERLPSRRRRPERTRCSPRRAAARAAAIELVEASAEALPFADGEFDALTFTYLLRYVDDPAATLRELARVVRPGGTIAGLEFGVPHGVWRPLWELHVRVGLPVAGAAIGNGWREVGSFLGPSIRGFYERWPRLGSLDAWQRRRHRRCRRPARSRSAEGW